MTIIRWALLALCIATFGDATAAEVPLTPKGGYKHSLRPFTGGWVNRDRQAPGAGYFLDVTPLSGRDYAFLTGFLYEPGGTPTWIAMQGFLDYSTEDQRRSTGITARLQANIYNAIGGTCWGCAPRTGSIVNLPPAGDLVFKTPVFAELTWNGSTLGITAAPETRNWDYAGYYLVMSRDYEATAAQVFTHDTDLSVVRLVSETARSYHVNPNALAATVARPPPAGARQYRLQCVKGDCVGQSFIRGFSNAHAPVLGGGVLWIDANGDGGMFNWREVSTSFFPTAYQINASSATDGASVFWYDTWVLGRGEEIIVRHGLNPTGRAAVGFDTYSEALLMRLPKGYEPEQNDVP